MNTQRELEGAICERIARFQTEYMGRGPIEIRSHVLDDLVIVRLHSVLTAAEQTLASRPTDKGRGLVKQFYTQLVESARPAMEAMIADLTGERVLSMHYDISTATGEEIVVFTLASAPQFSRVHENSVARV